MKTALIFIMFFTALGVHSKTLNESLSAFGKSHSELGQIVLSKNIEAKGEKKKYLTIGFSLKATKFEAEISSPVTPSDFDNKRKNISSMILKSYMDQPTPYSGVITNLTKCPKKFTPESLHQKFGNKEVFIVKALVGRNFNHGICEDNLVAFSSCTAFYLDIKNSHYYKTKVFTDPKQDCVFLTQKFFENLNDL